MLEYVIEYFKTSKFHYWNVFWFILIFSRDIRAQSLNFSSELRVKI